MYIVGIVCKCISELFVVELPNISIYFVGTVVRITSECLKKLLIGHTLKNPSILSNRNRFPQPPTRLHQLNSRKESDRKKPTQVFIYNCFCVPYLKFFHGTLL